MSKEKEEEGSCGVVVTSGCCKLEALVRVDERGQIVLPKDLREKAGIKAGDKLV
ncbi:MAG: AbrB/MazE/SpoVT family DNA-binding domain-containing protein, partial [Candidatus Bathyarchaeota archaeon]|nr:AbrB/MazE/SpoVT family DNA-binding domain-containing protein [Candidatus Bathyarchaeota archaeon]